MVDPVYQTGADFKALFNVFLHCTGVKITNFLLGGFIVATVVNPT